MKKTKLGQELLAGMKEIISHQEGKITPCLPPSRVKNLKYYQR